MMEDCIEYDDEELDELERQILLENSAPKCDTIDALEKQILPNKPPSFKTLVPVDTLFTKSSNFEEQLAESDAKIQSLIHSGDTDSSDDEQARNVSEQKYNDYGKSINTMINAKNLEKRENQISREIDQSSRLSAVVAPKLSTVGYTVSSPAVTPSPAMNIYIDPIFGMRITRPLISSALLKERMEGRTAVGMQRIARFIETNDLKQDWVVAGAIVSKSAVRKSQKGSQYLIWKLSDLKGDIKTISLFLFSSAYKDLWKTQEGTIVAVLNPTVFDKRAERSDEACLSVDNVQKVMILGLSKDLGKCRSKKKNGEPCTALVNVTDCDVCVYHVKQEYGAASRRGELQSVTVGRGLHDLRNKVLGKSEVFYAGQSFSAVRATKNPKQVKKDQDLMMKLSDYYQSPFQGQSTGAVPKKTAVGYAKSSGKAEIIAASVESNLKQRQKDIDRLQILRGNNPVPLQPVVPAATNKTPLATSSPVAPATSDKYQNFSFMNKTPVLSKDNFTFEISASKVANVSRFKALEILKKKPLEKSNPNFIKHRGTEAGKKRALEELNKQTESEANSSPAAKKLKLDQENAEKEKRLRLERIINAKSSHVDLIEARELDNQDRYFNNLEKKEAMEEKMLNTFKVACKAVICRECKYMAFSASDLCKTQKHPLRVIDGEKRFFKCLDCGTRTATLFRLPKVSCKQCNGSRWDRTAMIKERNVVVGEHLSIRGDEESYIGGMMIKGGNLNLMVPE